MEDFTASNNVPFRHPGEAALREPGRLNIKFLAGLEMIGEFSQELVGNDPALVVREAVSCASYTSTVKRTYRVRR